MSQSTHLLQIYDVVRTVHLERVVDRPGRTTVLYRSRRYDFDEQLASRLSLERAGILGAFRFALKTDVDLIEINEPLIARAAPRTLAVVAGNRIRALIRRRPRARVVTYAIASLDPWEISGNLPWRARVKWRAQSLLVPSVWKRVDRIAFGTPLAERIYRERFPRTSHGPESRLIPAIPGGMGSEAANSEGREGRMTFLGDLSVRKGFPQVLAAWASVRAAVPTSTLSILGKGQLRDEAQALASVDERVTFIEDPSRSRIFEVLLGSSVLVLPSQPMPLWREQVGLPIVEGLSAGCAIVTTRETGLADWLSAHGHQVVNAADVAALARAIEAALVAARPACSVLADLPLVDGREAAARWLHETGESEG